MTYSEAGISVGTLASGKATNLENSDAISCALCLPSTWYPEALADFMGASGFSFDPQVVTVYINQDISNFNTNISIGSFPGQYDLYSVLMHEICHGLGFKSNTTSSGASVTWYSGGMSFLQPGVFDQFIWDAGTGDAGGVNTNLVSLTHGSTEFTNFCTGAGNYTAYPNTSNSAYFNGTSASNIGLYLPSSYNKSVSLSHVSTLYPSSYLMSISLDEGDMVRCPTSDEINILNDIGWYGSIAAVGTSACSPLNYMTCLLLPAVVNPGTTYGCTVALGTYSSTTYSGYTLNESTISWSLYLYDNVGATVISCSGSGTPYLSLNPTLPSGHTFMRDLSGNIQGVLKITASDISGCAYSYTSSIGIQAPPDQPELTVDGGTGSMFSGSYVPYCSSKTIRFNAAGTEHYNVYCDAYNPTLGGWAYCASATLSPGVNTYTFTGLDETVAHSFFVEAISSLGYTWSNNIYTWPCEWHISASPNPLLVSNGLLTISATGGGTIMDENGGTLNLGNFNFSNVTITNMQNPNIVYTFPFNGTSSIVSLNLSQYTLPNGIYNLSCTDVSGQSGSTQISIQN